MAQPPVFIFAFANDRPGRFLRSIAGEQRAISRAFAPMVDKGLLKLEILPDARAEDLFEAFRKHSGQVLGFHYGGHADSLALLLKGARESLGMKGFAEFLAHQPGLALVFMNGCATADQREALEAAGVPHLILTETVISDEAAQDFAKQLYQSLATGHAVERAFAEAQGAVTARLGGERRGLVLEEPDTHNQTYLPWAYYPAPTSQPLQLRVERPSRTPLIAAAAAFLLILSALAWYLKPAPEPFDLTLLVEDARGHSLDALSKGDRLLVPPGHDLLIDTTAYTRLALLLDGEPRWGEFDAQGNVFFRQIDSRFRAAAIPVKLEGDFWQLTDSSARVTLTPPNQPIQITRTDVLCSLRVRLKFREQPLAGHEVEVRALPNASRLLATGQTDANGWLSIKVPADGCARQYLLQIDHPSLHYPVRDTVYPESGDAIWPID